MLTASGSYVAPLPGPTRWIVILIPNRRLMRLRV